MHQKIKRSAAAVQLMVLLFTGLPSSYSIYALGSRRVDRLIGWEAMPAILARIKPPKFPARDFLVTDYGARADAGDNTQAIRKAIACCGLVMRCSCPFILIVPLVAGAIPNNASSTTAHATT